MGGIRLWAFRCLVVFLWLFPLPAYGQNLEVVFFNVGQGDSLLLISPTGTPEKNMNERTLEARNLGRHLHDMNHPGIILLKITDPSWPDSVIFSLAPERVRTVPFKNSTWAKHGAWDKPLPKRPKGSKDYILVD